MVWQKPLDDVAENLGVTRNVLRTKCRKLEVPIPSRGHWSKVAAGKRVKRPKLDRASRPSLRGNLAAIAAKLAFEGEAVGVDRLPVTLERISLPRKSQRLSERALLLRDTLNEREVDSSGLVAIGTEAQLPNVQVSRAMIRTVAKVWHAIEREMDNRNIEFRPPRSSYDSPSFHCGHHKVGLIIEEQIERVTRKPSEEDKRRPSWEWDLSKIGPSGRLTFQIGDRYDRDRPKTIKQDEDEELEVVVARVVELIWGEFVRFHEDQLRQRKAAAEQAVKWKIQAAEQDKKDHAKRIEQIRHQRADNLVRAAHWWKLTDTVAAFIDAREAEWRAEDGTLTEPQIAWLSWARTHTSDIAPALQSYPDSLSDGPFDSETIEFGGPYPETKDVPWPPNLPQPPKEDSGFHGGFSQAETPYPFWLRHQR